MGMQYMVYAVIMCGVGTHRILHAALRLAWSYTGHEGRAVIAVRVEDLHERLASLTPCSQTPCRGHAIMGRQQGPLWPSLMRDADMHFEVL